MRNRCTKYHVPFTIFLLLTLFSCNPEARWETKKVTISMKLNNISAGFSECSFSTNKEAYYLINCVPAREGYDPMKEQKPFMMLALDSANLEYLAWRNELLKEGVSNIAPFASHALQYGDVEYVFTGLESNTHYWIYAFVVNPKTMEPAGKLYLMDAYTTEGSTMNVRFEYRVKGYWDYVYPMDENGTMTKHFPYLAATRDSLVVITTEGDSPEKYFGLWYDIQVMYPQLANIYYGVLAIENDGWSSYLYFEEGHTYYTYISGFDGWDNHHVIYKFTWTGENYEQYFTEADALPCE